MRMLKTVLAATLLLATISPALADDHEQDDPKRLTWLTYSKVRPGMMQKAIEYNMDDEAFMQEMVNDGTLLSWGMLAPVIRGTEDEWNLALWASAESWEKFGIWAAKYEEHKASLSADKQAARAKRTAEIFEDHSHHDEVVRHFVYNLGGPKAEFFYTGEFHVRKGQEGEVREFYDEYTAPIAEKLMEEGHISGYGAYAPDLPGQLWSHRFWYAMPDLGGVDAMLAAFREGAEEEGYRKADRVFQLSRHTSRVLMILHTGLPE